MYQKSYTCQVYFPVLFNNSPEHIPPTRGNVLLESWFQSYF